MKIKIVSEVGVNHNGSTERALRMIDIAAKAGVDVVKFQAYRAELLASRFAQKAVYQKKNTDRNETQLEMLKKLELPREIYPALKKRCRERGVEFLVTPFDHNSLNFLVKKIGVKKIKIPSGEITNGPFLLACAQSGLPIVLSTGMATVIEVRKALQIISFGYLQGNKRPSQSAFAAAYESENGRKILRKKVILLHCTTEYPTELKDVNLKAIDSLRESFSLPVGFSDHTKGIFAATAAAARGAVTIEKHFTLDRNLPGPDHKASLEPDELSAMVQAIRKIEVILGNGVKTPRPSELKNIPVARKSIVAKCFIKKGEVLKKINLDFKRPGKGISPMLFWEIIGKKANRDYKKDEIINIKVES